MALKCFFNYDKKVGLTDRNTMSLLYRVHSKLTYLRRRLRTYIMMAVLELSPENIDFFSSGRFQLPRKNERIKKTKNVLDDFVIIDDDGFQADEVNLIMRGNSFDLDKSKIRDNVYFVNGLVLKDSNKRKFESQHYWDERILYKTNFPITYVTSGGDAMSYMENNVPILYFDRVLSIRGEALVEGPETPDLVEKVKDYCAKRKDSNIIKVFHKSECKSIRPGSGLTSLVSLAKLTKKINVYGWDFYMDTSPSQLSHFEALRILTCSVNKTMRKDFKPLFEMSIIHWLYASRLKELKHINISGYLNEVDHHKKLINKISRVFYTS